MKQQRPKISSQLAVLLIVFLATPAAQLSALAQTGTASGQVEPSRDQGWFQRSEQAGSMLEKARQLAHSRDLNGAKALYERCFRLDPNDQSAMVHNNMAACLEGLGDWAGAAEQYKKALSFDPNLALAKKNLVNNQIQQLTFQAKELMGQLKYDDALKVYEQIVELDPSRAMSYNNLGTAYHAKSELDAAIEQYKKALSIESHMDLATINIARSYYNEGNFPEAAKYFNKYAKDHPDGKDANEARSTLATIASRGGGDQTDDAQGPDYFRSTTAKGVLRWPPGEPITVSIDSGEGVPGFQPAFRQAMIDALDQWTRASNNRLTWTLAAPGTKAAIDCHWTANNGSFALHGSNPDEQGEVSTYETFMRGDQRYIRHTTVLISTLNSKTGKLITEPEACDVCLHEIGHALGMVGHSPNYHDIMFFVTNPGGGSVLRKLSTRDIVTINKLYAGYPVQK